MNIDWASLFVGFILSIIISYYFFKKSESRKDLLIFHKSDLLQVKNHPDISISYKNQGIESLTMTVVLVANIGNRAIRQEDINYKLSISSISKIKLLSVTLIDKAEKIRAKVNDISDGSNDILLSFDYLNKNDYLILEVMHEGILDKEDEFIVETGHVVDGSIPVVYKYDNSVNQYGVAIEKLIFSVGAILLSPVVVFRLPVFIYEEYKLNGLSKVDIFLIGLISIGFCMLVVYAWKSVKNISGYSKTIKVFRNIPNNAFNKLNRTSSHKVI